MKIEHIGIAVESIEKAAAPYQLIGLELSDIEEVADQKVRVGMLPVGESKIELLEPTSEDSPIAKFLAKKGSGIHHLAFQVDDLVAELDRLKAEGVRLIDEKPRRGAHNALIAFLHPKSTGGVLIELCQHD